MKVYIFGLLSLIILFPIVYILPLGFTKKGKNTVVIVSIFIAALSLLSGTIFEWWQSSLLLFLLVIASVYIIHKRFSDVIYISSDQQLNGEKTILKSKDVDVKEASIYSQANSFSAVQSSGIVTHESTNQLDEKNSTETMNQLESSGFEIEEVERLELNDQIEKVHSITPEVPLVTDDKEEICFVVESEDFQREDEIRPLSVDNLEDTDAVEGTDFIVEDNVSKENGNWLNEIRVVGEESADSIDEQLVAMEEEAEELNDSLSMEAAPLEEEIDRHLIDKVVYEVNNKEGSQSEKHLSDTVQLEDVETFASGESAELSVESSTNDDEAIYPTIEVEHSKDLFIEDVKADITAKAELFTADVDADIVSREDPPIDDVATNKIPKDESFSQDIEPIIETGNMGVDIGINEELTASQESAITREADGEMSPSELNEEIFLMILTQLEIAKSQMGTKDYEQLLNDCLQPELIAQYYYTFANLLIQHYLENGEFTKLAQLLTQLEAKLYEYPIIMEEIHYLQAIISNK